MEALSVVDDFLNFLSILYPTPKSYELFLDLLKKHQVEGLQIHDFEIASIGLANGINRIATFNEKDFKEIEELEVYFPWIMSLSGPRYEKSILMWYQIVWMFLWIFTVIYNDFWWFIMTIGRRRRFFKYS